jgi:hypothetical protein
MGFKELSSIAGSHFLPSLTKEEAEKIGWPARDYVLADSIELKIVMMADKMVEKTSDRPNKDSLEKYLEYLRNGESPNRKFWSKCPELREKTVNEVTRIWKELQSMGWKHE